jgi:hypothetical protein
MNSSTTNSESNLLANASPSQSMTKAKQHGKDNRENKLQRFGGAVVNGGTLVFGKIKSLWSVNGSGLNMLADADRRQKSKSKENLGARLTSHISICMTRCCRFGSFFCCVAFLLFFFSICVFHQISSSSSLVCVCFCTLF